MKLKAVNKNREFLRAYKRGTSYVGAYVVMYVIKSRYGYTRFGITASKKIGNAIKRNRARRVIRESVRNLPFNTSNKMDIILVARGKTPYVKQALVQAEIETFAQKAGVLND